MRYIVIVEEGKTSFGAYAPDLPGCVAVAETREEVLQLMQEAIEFHIEGLKEEGLPIPEPIPDAHHPWAKFAGMFAEDLDFEAVQADIAAYRQEIDANPDI